MTYLPLPSKHTLEEYLSYDPSSGVLTWIQSPQQYGNNAVGKQAGTVKKNGYIRIQFKGRVYAAHRIAWMLVHGQDPGELQLDHINGNRSDNRLSNLRLVDNQVNAFNRAAAKGVSFHKATSKWEARIGINGQRRHLGLYESFDDARQAYLAAKQKYHITTP
jgi:HNH endonuclease/AP2 domain